MADSEPGQNRASCRCLRRFNYSSLLLFVLCRTRTKKQLSFQSAKQKEQKQDKTSGSL